MKDIKLHKLSKNVRKFKNIDRQSTPNKSAWTIFYINSSLIKEPDLYWSIPWKALMF